MGFNAVLLVSFLVVIGIQAVHRTAGAIAAVLWCLAIAAYGYTVFQAGAQIAFLGVHVELWQFLTFMGLMLAYNTWVLTRQLRLQRGG